MRASGNDRPGVQERRPRDGELRGRTVKAIVTLASPNGRSLMIDWTTTDDGMLGGHAGVMPVYRRDDGEYYSLIEGLPLTLALNLD